MCDNAARAKLRFTDGSEESLQFLNTGRDAALSIWALEREFAERVESKGT